MSKQKSKELSLEDLEKVTGGTEVPVSSLSEIKKGDVVYIKNSLVDGLFCLVSISELGSYKFAQYIPNEYVDFAYHASTIVAGCTIKIVSHDDAFAEMND